MVGSSPARRLRRAPERSGRRTARAPVGPSIASRRRIRVPTAAFGTREPRAFMGCEAPSRATAGRPELGLGTGRASWPAPRIGITAPGSRASPAPGPASDDARRRGQGVLDPVRHPLPLRARRRLQVVVRHVVGQLVAENAALVVRNQHEVGPRKYRARACDPCGATVTDLPVQHRRSCVAMSPGSGPWATPGRSGDVEDLGDLLEEAVHLLGRDRLVTEVLDRGVTRVDEGRLLPVRPRRHSRSTRRGRTSRARHRRGRDKGMASSFRKPPSGGAAAAPPCFFGNPAVRPPAPGAPDPWLCVPASRRVCLVGSGLPIRL